MTGVDATGRLRLTAATKHGRTVLTEAYRTAPFHPGPVHNRNGRAVVVLQDVSPGILPGDRLAIDIVVEAGACLTVVGQSATKLFPSPDGVPAELTTSLSVAAHSSLWWLPGPLIPYRDAVYRSRLHVALDEGASFALLEILTPGRTAMGESDVYTRLDLRLRIDVAGKPLLIERAVLDPVARPPRFTSEREAFRCSGSLILVGYQVPDDFAMDRDDVWIGADGGPDLAVLRGVSRAAEPLRETLLAVLHRLQDDRPSPVPGDQAGSD